jgi:hypothetical protein
MEHLEACMNCRFFIAGNRGSEYGFEGECHATAPGQFALPSDDVPPAPPSALEEDVTILTWHDTSYIGWPVVKRSDWCGEYEPPRS